MAARLSDASDGPGGVIAAGAAPGYELDRIDPALAAFHLGDEGIRLAELRPQCPDREAGTLPLVTEEPAHPLVRRSVLSPCTHIGLRLRCPLCEPSLGSG